MTDLGGVRQRQLDFQPAVSLNGMYSLPTEKRRWVHAVAFRPKHNPVHPLV